MKEKEDINKKVRTLADDYQSMKQDRQPYLEKAKEACKYTIPSLIADNDVKKTTRTNAKKIETPNQSVGADGVNNLSAKIAVTMLPPNQTFFKFSMDTVTIKQQATVEGSDATKFEQDVNKGLSIIEKLLLDYQEQLGDRVCVGEAIKHQLVAGNVFLIHDPNDGLRYYPLDRFVVKRDYCGNVLKAITEETVGFYSLPEDVQDEVLIKILEKKATGKLKEEKLEDLELTLYTGFKRTKKQWKVWQEVEGVKIPSSEGTYPIEICPFMALRYTAIDGESYGRGLIEEYIGDISYLDVLSLAIKQASLAGSKLVMLVNPNGMTKIKHLSEAKNGGFALGRIEDVQPLQANKYYDLQVAQAEADKIERRLNRIFIMKAAIQRQAERVTAEEIRTMAQDLEEALGNYYSIMCREFQKAYVKITFHHLKKQKGRFLPDLVRDKNVKLTVTTGLEALGRSSDLNKLITFWDVMGRVASTAVQLGGKVEPIAEVIAASLNINIDGWFYSEEEKAEQQKEAQQQELMKAAAPNAINKYGDAMMQQQQMEAQQ